MRRKSNSHLLGNDEETGEETGRDTFRPWTSPEKYRVFAFMNFVGVPLVHALGYAPGWAGVGEDLPKGVFLQWAGE